jgi:hypothetical protein
MYTVCPDVGETFLGIRVVLIESDEVPTIYLSICFWGKTSAVAQLIH